MRLKWHLPVSGLEVLRREPASAKEGVEAAIRGVEGCGVLGGDMVQVPVVNVEGSRPVLLLN